MTSNPKISPLPVEQTLEQDPKSPEIAVTKSEPVNRNISEKTLVNLDKKSSVLEFQTSHVNASTCSLVKSGWSTMRTPTYIVSGITLAAIGFMLAIMREDSMMAHLIRAFFYLYVAIISGGLIVIFFVFLFNVE